MKYIAIIALCGLISCATTPTELPEDFTADFAF